MLQLPVINTSSSEEICLENEEIVIDPDDIIIEDVPWEVPPRKTGIVAERRLMYINWVNGVLRQLNSCSKITKLRIWFNFEIRCNSEGDIDRWLEFAISKRVEYLEISLGDADMVFDIPFADDYKPAFAFEYLSDYADQLESLSLEIHPLSLYYDMHQSREQLPDSVDKLIQESIQVVEIVGFRGFEMESLPGHPKVVSYFNKQSITMGNCSPRGIATTASNDDVESSNLIRVRKDSGEIVEFKSPKLARDVVIPHCEYLVGGQFHCLLPIPAKVEALPENEAASSVEKEEKSDVAALHVLPSHREGVWKVKLVINTKRLGGDFVRARECGGVDREDEDG
ncbi:hypothetical protein LINPERHAP2_LOCUS19752 [Linum perenne]